MCCTALPHRRAVCCNLTALLLLQMGGGSGGLEGQIQQKLQTIIQQNGLRHAELLPAVTCAKPVAD